MSVAATEIEPKPKRKRQRRSIETQEKLLTAALAAFSERGFQGTSTRDIADRAGVHHPLITYHFKSKEELWRTTADRIFTKLRVLLENVIRDHQDDARSDRMESIIRAYVAFVAEHPELHRLMVQESSYVNPRLDWLLENHLRPMFDMTVQEIAELQKDGVVPPGNAAMLFFMLRVSAGSLYALAPEVEKLSQKKLGDPASVKELTDLIIRVFMPGKSG